MSMTIAGLAKAGDVGVETVRYYQRRGLMPTPERPESGGSAGGIRRYDEDDVRRLRFIRAAQSAGFSLEEIAALLTLDATADRRRALEMARARIAKLDARIAELTVARGALARLAEACAADTPGPCPIIATFVA